MNWRSNLPVPLGTVVRGWGKVVTIRYQGGERYYMLLKNGDTSLIPASLIESAALYQPDDTGAQPK